MKKIFTADRVIPAIVDLVYLVILLLAFNLMLTGALNYISDIRGVEALAVGFGEMAPLTIATFIAAWSLHSAKMVLNSPTRFPEHKPSTEKEEENE